MLRYEWSSMGNFIIQQHPVADEIATESLVEEQGDDAAHAAARHTNHGSY